MAANADESHDSNMYHCQCISFVLRLNAFRVGRSQSKILKKRKNFDTRFITFLGLHTMLINIKGFCANI